MDQKRRSEDGMFREVAEIRRSVQASKDFAEQLKALVEENRQILLAIQEVLVELKQEKPGH